jgi:trk system potassium uptake protein TrkH
MWARFHGNDIRVIAHYLGSLLVFLAFTMLVPLIVAVAFQEWRPAAHFLLGFGIAFVCGAALRLAKVNPGHLDRKQAIAVTGLAWVVGALFACIPLWLSGAYLSGVDAFFDSVSGFTATGLTLATDIDHMAMSEHMWRFTLQFLGGQGVVVVALSLGIFARTSGSLYTAEGREEAILPGIKKTAQFIWRFSSAVVGIGTLVLMTVFLLLGMDLPRSFFHGLWITIGAYDTGGFAPSSLSLSYYHSWPLEVVVTGFMCLGALNFALLAQVHKGNWRAVVRDIEVRTMMAWAAGMCVLFVAALMAGNFLTDYSSLVRRGVFTILSATTNAGYQVMGTGQLTELLPSGALLLVALSMAVGGSVGSTAGGIKALRVGLILKGFTARVKSVLLPQSAQITTTYQHIGQRTLTNELLSSALIIAALYVIAYISGALIAVAMGYDALPAAFESISVTTNAGLSSGITEPGMPLLLKLVYIVQMWAGRLEFVTLMALAASFIVSFKPNRRVASFVRRRRQRR